MPRPFKCRKVHFNPKVDYFKPRAIPLSMLEEVNLTIDEFEAVRLANLEDMYQEDAAKKMKISRQTFGNIIKSAHKKIADALINGKAIKIEGGVFKLAGKKKFGCNECEHLWEVAYGSGQPSECPSCKSNNLRRAEEDRGWARNAGFGRGRGRCGR